MAPIQSAVFAALGGYAGLSNLVGARIYPDAAPQDAAKPYVVWQEISAVSAADLDGSAESSSLDNYRIQVSFWDRNATKSREGNKQVRLAMAAATQFKSLHVDERSLGFEQETKLNGMQSDFSVWLKT